MAKKCPECGSPYLVEKTLRSGIFLECPNKKKAAEEETAPKKRAKKVAKGAAKGAAAADGAVVCSYSKRIGDAPPLPTAETHGPVVEKQEREEGVAAGVENAVAALLNAHEAESVSMGQRRNDPMERMLATPADAEIILRLYELRTEAVMRQARAWMTGEFWPATAEEFFAVAENPADPHNAWLRQVLTYWEMAAAMVLHGAVSAELFVDCNGEGFFLLAKFAPILDGYPGEESGVSDQDLGAGQPVFSGGAALRGGAEECGSPAQEPGCRQQQTHGRVFLSCRNRRV